MSSCLASSSSESLTSSAISHTHASGLCPVSGRSHEWCPAQQGDVRSPCPALNTLANHGYLPRNGKHISVFDLANSLQTGYNLSFFFSWFLSIVSFFLLKQFGHISLSDLARHNRIEHDASLVHHNAQFEDEYAPCEIDSKLFGELVADAATRDADGKARLNAEDTARARVRRECVSPALDGVHAEIARGEMAIALNVFGGLDGAKVGIPIEWLREWVVEERIPTGWKPTHTQGLMQTVKTSKVIRLAMKAMTDKEDMEEAKLAEQEAMSIMGSFSDTASSSGGDSLFPSPAESHSTLPSDDEEESAIKHKKPVLRIDPEY